MGSAFAFTLRSKTAMSDHDSRASSPSLNATPRSVSDRLGNVAPPQLSGSVRTTARRCRRSRMAARRCGFIAFVSRALFCSMKARAVSTTPSLARKFSSSGICSTVRVPLANVRMFSYVTAAPLVDRLVVVADDADARTQFVQRPDDRLLDRIDVLVLVHDDVLHPRSEALSQRLVVGQSRDRLYQDGRIVEVSLFCSGELDTSFKPSTTETPLSFCRSPSPLAE